MPNPEPPRSATAYTRWALLLSSMLLLTACAAAPPLPPGISPLPTGGETLDGMFGPMRVNQRGSVRTLYFIHDDGLEEIQTEIDLLRPGHLISHYTRAMFASYFAVPRPARVLIVGVGGGAMVRFLQARDPTVEVNAVEIDAVIIDIADRYFGTRSSQRVRIHHADAFDYLADTKDQRWDVIHMDAFLQPDESTDEAGVPLRLRTRAFLEGLSARVTPGGVVVFNLSVDEGAEEHAALIEEVFGAVWRFEIEESSNVVIVAGRSLVEGAVSAEAGEALDERLEASFSFEELAGWLAR